MTVKVFLVANVGNSPTRRCDHLDLQVALRLKVQGLIPLNKMYTSSTARGGAGSFKKVQ